MNRRTFAVSLGTLVGGGAALGTGAFSSLTADRDFDVVVSGDAGAYLGIQPHPGPNGAYAETTPRDTLAVDLTGDNSNIGSGIAGGEGVNANAVSSFRNVFRITNQGTQAISVEIDPLVFLETDLPESVLGVAIVPAIDNPIRMAPGDAQDFHLIAFSFEADGEPDLSVDERIDILAEEA